MNQEITKFAATSIHNHGIRVFDEESSYYKIWRVITYVIMTSMILISISMYAISNGNDIEKILQCVPHLAVTSIIMGCTIIMIHHRKTIREMMRQMDKVYVYPDDVLLEKEATKWYTKEKNFIMASRVLKFISFTVLPIYSAPFVGQWYIDGTIDLFLFPCWTPWTLDNPNWQLFTIFLQMMLGVILIFCISIIVDCILVGVYHFITQYEKLNEAVRSIKSRAMYFALNDPRYEDRFDELMKENIAHCVKHHQMLHKNFRLFDVWFRALFSWILTIYYLTSAFGIFVATSDYIVLVQNLEIFLGMCALVFIPCCLGEIFYDLNQNLADTIFYETEWYEATKENRRLLMIFHALACKPFIVTAFSIYGASFAVFGEIINSAYSNFNTLNDIMKIKNVI